MRLVTRAAAAELAGVSVRTITRYAAEGKLTKYRTRDDAIGFDADQVADAFARPDGAPASSVAELFLALRSGAPAGEVTVEPAWRGPDDQPVPPGPRPKRW